MLWIFIVVVLDKTTDKNVTARGRETVRPKLNVAILGTGNIGTDLLIKVHKSPILNCTMFAGRDPASQGIKRAKALGTLTSDGSINALLATPDSYDLVFDATSASAHMKHWPKLRDLGKGVIDMTPSMIGNMAVPAIGLSSIRDVSNVNMISCGGQASIPLVEAISHVCSDISYIEVVSSIASSSAGPATRVNIDEYIENTEAGLCLFSGCDNVKTIMILNPALPHIDMQVAVSVTVSRPEMENVLLSVEKMVDKVAAYVPGYAIVVPPVYDSNRIFVMVRVCGAGDYLPKYAGNLDIINCAAIAVAHKHAEVHG